AVRRRVAELFAELPREAEAAFDPPLPGVPLPGAEPEVKQVATLKPVAAVKIGFGPVVERAHPDYADLTVPSRLFSNFPVGWLDQALRGTDGGLVYADWAFLSTGLVPGYFEIAFNTKPETAAEAVAR